ncbi:MAG: hypothetical protein HUU47_08870 [Bacteroidetes bacterium]|nr:hypothetical protein [Bacteroidota bacterium]
MVFKIITNSIKTPAFIVIFFTLLYIFLSNNNSETDAYAYAISVKSGENLIFPHHLFYCFPARFLIKFIKITGLNPDALWILKLINSISAGFCIYFLGKILKLLNNKKNINYLVFAGSFFGFMRFATEGETYIIPIMFSLIATYFFIISLQKNNVVFLFFSGLLFGISILFHQIHFFWFAGFVLSMLSGNFQKKITKISIYVMPSSILVFLVYFYAAAQTNSTIINFTFHDYLKGNANVFIGFNNFLMLPISIFRTFFQAHGYIFFFVQKYKFLILIIIAFAGFASFLVYKFLKSVKFKKSENSILQKAILYAFILHFLFAFFSVSNAEFMVMLPFLGLLWLELKFHFNIKYLLKFSILMLFWNVCFGLIPLHFSNIDGSKNLIYKAQNANWIFYNPQKMENMGEYYFGEKYVKNFFRLNSINTLIKNNQIEFVYTDFFNEKDELNRRKLLFKKDSFYIKFKTLNRFKVDSINYSFGKKYIYKVELK